MATAPEVNPEKQKIIKRLMALGASHGFRYRSPTYEDNPSNHRDPIQSRDPDKRPGVDCFIVDTVTGKQYATAFASDENSALTAALDLAEKSPKPLTPAQEADRAAGRVDPRDAEIERLRRENEALKSQGEVPAPSIRRGVRVMADPGPAVKA